MNSSDLMARGHNVWFILPNKVVIDAPVTTHTHTHFNVLFYCCVYYTLWADLWLHFEHTQPFLLSLLHTITSLKKNKNKESSCEFLNFSGSEDVFTTSTEPHCVDLKQISWWCGEKIDQCVSVVVSLNSAVCTWPLFVCDLHTVTHRTVEILSGYVD